MPKFYGGADNNPETLEASVDNETLEHEPANAEKIELLIVLTELSMAINRLANTLENVIKRF